MSKVVKFVLFKLHLVLEEVERTSGTGAKNGGILLAHLYELQGLITAPVMKNCFRLLNVYHTHGAFLLTQNPIDGFVALQQAHRTNPTDEGHLIGPFAIRDEDGGRVDQSYEILP